MMPGGLLSRSRRQRVLHFKSGPFLPLTENWIYTQIQGLKKWEPVVYCSTRENADTFPVDRLRVFDWGNWRPWSLANRVFSRLAGYSPAMLAALREDSPEVIHAHFGQSGYAALGLKRAFPLPLVTTFYGFDLIQMTTQGSKWHGRGRRLFQNGDLFMVEGGHMRSRLVALGCPGDRAVVQHIGIVLDDFPYRPRGLGDSREAKILVAATFSEKKGIPYAIEAVGLVKRRNPGLAVRLTIIGDSRGFPADVEEKKKILSAISRFELEGSVDLLGFVPNAALRKHYYEHHIFLSPSVTAKNGDAEGGAPVSIIEASATGMPVVATTHCDIPEIVVDRVSGLLAPERDSLALARRLELLLTNPSRWPEFGRAGRRRIEMEYDAARQAGRLEQIYDEVSNRRQPA